MARQTSSSSSQQPPHRRPAGHLSRPSSLRRQKSYPRDALPPSVRTLVALRLCRSEDDGVSPGRVKSLYDDDEFPEDEVDTNLKEDDTKTEYLTDEERENGDDNMNPETEEGFLNRYNVSIFDTRNAPRGILGISRQAGLDDDSFARRFGLSIFETNRESSRQADFGDDDDSFARRFGLSIFETNRETSFEEKKKNSVDRDPSTSLLRRSYDLSGVDTEDSTPVRAHNGKTKLVSSSSTRLPRHLLLPPLPQRQSYYVGPKQLQQKQQSRVEKKANGGMRNGGSSQDRHQHDQDIMGPFKMTEQPGRSRWAAGSDASVDAVLLVGEKPRRQGRSKSTGNYERFRRSGKVDEDSNLKEESGSVHSPSEDEDNDVEENVLDAKRKKSKSMESRSKFSLWREIEDLCNDCTYFCRCVQRDVCG